MIANTTYISFGVSPDADGIVMQTFYWDGKPGFAFVIAFADITSRFLGAVLLTGLKAYFQAINNLADSLVPKNVGKANIHMDDYSGQKRDLHVRVNVDCETLSLVIRRFCRNGFAIGDPRHIALGPLMAVGPDAVVDRVGSTVLAELAALHPDVPALTADVVTETGLSNRPAPRAGPA